MTEHNHITRDIKPLWGGCRGCDEYHVNALNMKIAELRAERDAARAEVDRLNIEIGKVVDSRERNRVEMEQKVINARHEAALARAEVTTARRVLVELGHPIEAPR